MDTNLAHRIAFLADLPAPDVDALLASSRRVPFGKGQTLLAQGVQNDRLFLVAEGKLHVRRKDPEGEALLGRLEAGDFFGEMSLFDPAPTSAEVSSVTSGALVEITRESLARFLAERPAAAPVLLLGFLRDLCRRLRTADAKIADVLHWSRMVR